MPYTQANRPIRINTELGPDVLLLDGFHGVEAISMPFGFRVDLLSETEDIDPLEVLRTPVAITIAIADGTERTIHGRVSRFSQAGQHDDLTAYSAEVVPWLWFLSLSRESRIYQNLSVLEIVEQVFRDRGYTDFDIRCTREYPSRDYCVQYRETHLNFVQRLLEEEGIFYFFTHTADKHVLVLADDNGRFETCPGIELTRFGPDPRPGENIVSSLEREHSAFVGTVTLRDYDYLQPSLTLESALSGDGEEEIYDYPGSYTSVEHGDRYARVLLETEEASRQVVRGESTCRGFQAGCSFELTDHYRADIDGDYVLTRVQHFARMGSYRAWDEQQSMEYRNDFLAIPAGTPYRPPRRATKPVVHGSQTALVTGPAGEEVYVDKHGRIKVQFYWDRVGGKDENSSCWIRVVSPWAGKGWGNVSIPRIGNEVVVEFLEGDPDRPLITGSVYNAEQTPPFELPGSGIQMGMKSRSSPGGGGYNEITATDTKGKEGMTIHAQYNMNTTVENDQTNTINNNRTTSVAVDDSETVGSNQSISVGANQDITVGADRSVTVGSNESVTVGANQDVTVGANRSVATGATDAVDAGLDIERKAGVNVRLEAGVEFGASGGAMAKIEAPTIMITGPVVQIGDVTITIQGQAITLSAGGSSIAITPAGIVMSGPMITSAASGMNKIMGGVVMIN